MSAMRFVVCARPQVLLWSLFLPSRLESTLRLRFLALSTESFCVRSLTQIRIWPTMRVTARNCCRLNVPRRNGRCCAHRFPPPAGGLPPCPDLPIARPFLPLLPVPPQLLVCCHPCSPGGKMGSWFGPVTIGLESLSNGVRGPSHRRPLPPC